MDNFYGKEITAGNFFKIFGIITILILVLDLIWINMVMKERYYEMIYNIQNSSISFRVIPAILSYITIILSIVLFVIPRITADRRFLDSLLYGGLLGLFMYGMFNFTNYTLIEKWSSSVVILDTMWGVVLYTIVAFITSLFLV